MQLFFETKLYNKQHQHLQNNYIWWKILFELRKGGVSVTNFQQLHENFKLYEGERRPCCDHTLTLRKFTARARAAAPPPLSNT